ncbi:MAG TPA: TIGR03435 family protein [Bryobacteraceae bacterium]
MNLLIALAILPASALFAQDLTGTWQGAVRNPDTQQELRTVLKIALSNENPIKANFYSIDQTYLVFPATLTVQASVVKLSIPGIGASYQGKLSADGATLSGTLKGFSIPVQWTMKRVSADQAWAIPKPPAPHELKSADPAFEVATVKPSRPDTVGRGMRVQGGNVSTLNMTLADLVTFAYDIHSHQIIGAPAWVTSDRFDISGKAEGEGQPSTEQLKVMLRKLLADRFQLVLHKGQRELPVYTLNVAKGGVKISKNDVKNETTGVIFRGPGSVLLNDVSMDDFCKMLQNAAVDRPVVNQTSLSGKYDFSLVWTPDQALTAVPNPNALAPGDKAEAPPDLYTAIQEQLGLKLEAAKLRIEVLVFDKVEKPSEN